MQRLRIVLFLARKAFTIFCGAHWPTDNLTSSFLAKCSSTDVMHINYIAGNNGCHRASRAIQLSSRPPLTTAKCTSDNTKASAERCRHLKCITSSHSHHWSNCHVIALDQLSICASGATRHQLMSLGVSSKHDAVFGGAIMSFLNFCK